MCRIALRAGASPPRSGALVNGGGGVYDRVRVRRRGRDSQNLNTLILTRFRENRSYVQYLYCVFLDDEERFEGSVLCVWLFGYWRIRLCERSQCPHSNRDHSTVGWFCRPDSD